MNIAENLKEINQKISDVKTQFNINRNVKLMAVSKFHTIEEIEVAINAGQNLFGENRVQEACEKFEILLQKYPQIELHIIGNLQTNKVKKAVQIASCIQSVDSIKLLDEIEKQCTKIDKVINILFEIHTAEDSKSGFTSLDELSNAFELFVSGKYPHIKPCGFMTMAPFTEDEEQIKKSFSTLKNIATEFQTKYNQFDLSELSMGMSGDFEIAIQEGSTLVRVGTAIFGQRDYSKK